MLGLGKGNHERHICGMSRNKNVKNGDFQEGKNNANVMQINPSS